MAEAGFLTCFIIAMVQVFSKSDLASETILAASLIGIGLCAIAEGLKK